MGTWFSGATLLYLGLFAEFISLNCSSCPCSLHLAPFVRGEAKGNRSLLRTCHGECREIHSTWFEQASPCRDQQVSGFEAQGSIDVSRRLVNSLFRLVQLHIQYCLVQSGSVNKCRCDRFLLYITCIVHYISINFQVFFFRLKVAICLSILRNINNFS